MAWARATPQTLSKKYKTRLESSLVTYLAKPLKRKVDADKIPKDFREFFIYVCTKAGLNHDGIALFPEYLAPMIGRIIHKDLNTGEAIHGTKTVVCTPPRHLKSTASLVALLYCCIFYRKKKMIYSSYSVETVREQAQTFTKMALALGYDKGVMDKKIINGNIIYFKALKGGITSLGSNWVTILDDPTRNEDDARSESIREQTRANFETTLLTRSQSENLSIFVIGTRFDYNDILGHCIRKLGFETYICPAINKRGEALFPELHSKEWLLQQKSMMVPYRWETLYQCAPPEDVDQFSVFKRSIRRHSELDFNDPRNKILKVACGIDLSYSMRKSSDLCAFVRIGQTMSGKYIIQDIFAEQCSLETFFRSVHQLIVNSQPLHWYCSSVEAGFKAEIEQTHNVKIKTHNSLGKLANSKFFAEAHNAGLVYYPDDWTADNNELLREMSMFTGQQAEHDDALDSASVAFDQLHQRKTTNSPDPRFFGVRI